jgi:hypothetical protein
VHVTLLSQKRLALQNLIRNIATAKTFTIAALLAVAALLLLPLLLCGGASPLP